MSTIVYQNSHSFFDTHLSEPRSLSLKLNHPQCPTPPPPSIDSLITFSSNIDVYVHPTAKRSNALSKRSLEMCTENLGSETGTDTTDADDIFAMLSLDDHHHRSVADEEVGRRRRTLGWKTEARKAGYESLPPPLTTANTLRVQRRIESGRLVMTAVSACPQRSTIHAERSNGRLTMSLVEDEEETSIEEEEEQEEEKEEEGGVIKGGGLVEEGKDGISVGGRIGIGEYQRPSRCNEGGHRSSSISSRRLINWEPYCVAT